MIVGLGNPGPEYERTRHNAGFWLLDRIAAKLGCSFSHERGFHGELASARFHGDKIWLLKPLTYMNRSGQSVGALCRFHKLEAEQVLVVHDELDLLPGIVKMKQGGSHAGHNGLKDIQAALGSANFWRWRIGIGHPRSLGLAQDVVDFVLHPPRLEEQGPIEQSLQRCLAVLPLMLSGNFEAAARTLHATPKAALPAKVR